MVVESLSDKISEVSVTVVYNGPVRIKGKVTFIDKDGREEIRDGMLSLCRCTKTSNPPFCDGSHKNLLPLLDE